MLTACLVVKEVSSILIPNIRIILAILVKSFTSTFETQSQCMRKKPKATSESILYLHNPSHIDGIHSEKKVGGMFSSLASNYRRLCTDKCVKFLSLGYNAPYPIGNFQHLNDFKCSLIILFNLANMCIPMLHTLVNRSKKVVTNGSISRSAYLLSQETYSEVT